MATVIRLVWAEFPSGAQLAEDWGPCGVFRGLTTIRTLSGACIYIVPDRLHSAEMETEDA